MLSHAVLVQQPSIDFTQFLGVSHEMFDHAISAKSDASHKQLTDTERFLSCLAAMQDEGAPVSLPPNLLTHVSFSVLIAINDREMLDVLTCCSKMPFVVADTVVRGVQAAVITGSLSQWRRAVLAGCRPEALTPVRELFNKILSIFEAACLDVWMDCRKRAGPNNTLLLEDLR